MKCKSNRDYINCLGEFSCPGLESTFFQQDMQKSLRFIKPIILILGILNTLFLIPDYFLIQNKMSFLWIATVRICFVLLVIGLFLRLNKINNLKILSYLITSYEIICAFLFLFVFYMYESPNFLIQSFGVMVIIIAIYMVPNRWIHMIGVSSFITVCFLVTSKYRVDNIKLSELSAVIVYLVIVILLSSIIAFRNQHAKRSQYLHSKELERLSTTDHLSGAYNRAKLDEELKKWVMYAKVYNTPLSLIIFDFDNFKRINDTYGHLCGDEVIVETAKLVRNSIRDIDIFARWGGEEFIILLPHMKKERGKIMAERLRQKIADYDFPKVGHATCSFGVAELCLQEDINSWLRRADEQLYKAKNTGKNIVKA
ncbi:diguanylate cyclase [Serpentinicella sp. ANB-PHB4]|uniref:GGDEF domain-containing protein n=1 Tax=Serpentinicella sp. ANB-PHB4 TaxID=3074076 RepID=UPI00285F62A0|nr:diguanylate cyclase [Serpentinicella sp. ANB-PHB4]MDR5659637.1 diguanylate cyclase [Serpentinicella sp. ANB-PHB4]